MALQYVLLMIHLVAPVWSWMEAPYGNDEFNYREEYGQNITLTCMDDRVPDSSTFEYWIRPDLTVMLAGQSDGFSTLGGYSGWQVSRDGMEIYATLLNEKQFGFYYCVVSDSGQKYVVKKAVNYGGPYFGNRWPKYRMNTIIGLSAAGVFLVLAMMFLVIVSCCEKDRDEGEDETTNQPIDDQDQMNQNGQRSKYAPQDVYASEDHPDYVFQEVRL